MQELPLKEVFQRAHAILKQLEVAPSDPATQRLVARGAQCLRAAAAAVDTLALFSANEDRDDLATTDIKYLLIPFYQAEVAGYTHAGGDGHPGWLCASQDAGAPAPCCCRCWSNRQIYFMQPSPHATLSTAADPRVRLAALSGAVQHYRAFLHRCRQYGLLSPPAAALAEVALRQAEAGEDGVRGSGSGGGVRVADATTLRQNKIEKFKR